MSDEWAPEAPRTLPPEGIIATRKIRILSDADAYKNNLQWSQLAVDYAKEALPIGSSNKLGISRRVSAVRLDAWLACASVTSSTAKGFRR